MQYYIAGSPAIINKKKVVEGKLGILKLDEG